MKRFLLFFLLFLCLMLSSCLRKDGISEETAPDETVTITETEPAESETMPRSEETVALETEQSETAGSETEPAETEVPETEMTVSAPPFGTPGVFFADSFAVLTETSGNDDPATGFFLFPFGSGGNFFSGLAAGGWNKCAGIDDINLRHFRSHCQSPAGTQQIGGNDLRIHKVFRTTK